MKSSFNGYTHIALFGESHGLSVGAVIDGFVPGFFVDEMGVKAEMKRRAPSLSFFSTDRRERDEVSFESGIFKGYTTGAPILLRIQNEGAKSEDYEGKQYVLRPSHADYTAFLKQGGFQDFRGGGHFSGRLTAPLVAAGALYKQYLETHQVHIVSHLKKVGKQEDRSFLPSDFEAQNRRALFESSFPCLSSAASEKMKMEILSAKEAKDSVGAIIEGAILGVNRPIGGNFFEGLESKLAQMFFAVPGVKGVSFGDGFALAAGKGSECNDAYGIKEGKIQTQTNHQGGISGGIANGMPILFQVGFKPTSSIGLPQETVNYLTMKKETIQIEGRHDPCIGVRGLPVVEAMAAICIGDLYMKEAI